MEKRGFTIIELLTVITIIAILSAIIVAGLSSARASGRDTKRVADVKAIQLALSLYYNDNQKYPSNIYAASPNGLAPTYISVVPKDPNGLEYIYDGYTTHAGGNCTLYPATKYHLGTILEVAALQDDDADSAGLGSFTGCNFENFPGNSPDCANSGVPERCYDVTP